MKATLEIKQERVKWIDVSRGIGIILVILGHLKFPYLSTWLYTFHMPLFFFLSGCVWKNRPTKEFFLKEIKSLFIPYWSLGIVIWLFYVIINILSSKIGPYGTNVEMLCSLIKQQGFWTIWFLACLFISQIIFYLLIQISRNNNKVLLGLSFSICVIAFIYYRFNGTILPWDIDIACVAQFFLCMGYLFVRNSKVKNAILESKGFMWAALSGALLLINVVTGYLCIKVSGHSLDMSIGMYGNELLTMISALAGSLFIVSVANKVKWNFLVYLGQNTLIIFAWHSRIVIVLLDYLFKHIGLFAKDNTISSCLYCLFSFVVVLAILIPITEIIKKSRIHKLFGV